MNFWESIGNFFTIVTSEFGFMDTYVRSSDAVSILLVCLAFLTIIAIAYLLGSINFAIIISGRKYKQDIREFGSKNAGMTNMMRTYGKKAAAFTLGGDALKAIVACCIGFLIFGRLGAYWAGLFCMIGHVFPIFYKFKGGKGVVTAAATVLITDWPTFIILFTIFVVMVAIWRYISLASITCMAFYPLVLNFISKLLLKNVAPFYILLPSIFMAALIIGKHWANIQRLRAGKESKFSFKKSVKAPEQANDNNTEAKK